MEERKNNTGLVVLITVLVMLVLGMGAFIIYDKVINKTNELNSEENNKVDNNNINDNSNVNSNDKIIELNKNEIDAQLLDLIDIIPNLLKEAYNYTLDIDKFLQFTDSEMYLAAINARDDILDAYDVDRQPFGELNLFLEATDLEKSFKELFGPDVSYVNKTFDNKGICGVVGTYDSNRHLYWGSNQCGGGGFCWLSYELKKIEQQGDVITVSYKESKECDDGKSTNVTRKINFKKQSDGKYYIDI